MIVLPITEHDRRHLTEEGWELLSETPMLVRHRKTGDIATGYAAECVLRDIDPSRRICHCGNQVDYSDMDCIHYRLCANHAQDI